MRRPAQHPAPTAHAAPGWAHPYTGIPAMAVFYNDGGHDNGQPPMPSPADLANRAPQPQPASPQPVIDKDTGVVMTQERFNKIMTRQYEKSRNSAYREMAQAAGIPFDPDNFDPSTFAQLLKDAQEARQAQLSEEQRRAEEIEREKQALQAEKTKAEQERAAIQAERRALAREQALTRLGALDQVDEHGNVTAPNLQDALAMLERDLRDTPDADPAALAKAAEALKARRPELFGAAPAPQTLPPAPSGGPAGGNAPRQPSTTKDAVREAARARARAMGLRNDEAA
ncbi:hypothetical protein ACPCTG_31875 [Streptomyces pseudogriseolus]|uniref:hypothetical protein n=1 Tax=Streptomyces pseudogriseolus TaxID=36817 RepID=UPI003FA30499